MAKKVIMDPARSLREFRLLTGKTDSGNVISKVSLKTRLCRLPGRKSENRFLELNIPLVSAAMQAVSGSELAIALAQHGGISVIPSSLPIEKQARMITDIKKFKAGFQEDVITLSKTDKISKIIGFMKETGYTSYFITDDGSSHGKLIGIITENDFDPHSHASDAIEEHMQKKVNFAYEGITLKEANRLMVKYGRGTLPIVDRKGKLKYVVFKKDVKKHIDFPESVVDSKKRYLAAAAVSTQPKDRERIDMLIKMGVDVIFIDASDGYSEFQADTLKYIRSKSKKVPVVGGNVITKDGFKFLAEAGFDAIKVGMGIGSGCTTQEQKGTGRGQATALISICSARDAYYKKTGKYLPVIADGGLSGPSQMVVALAIGADALMLGSFFAQFTESAGPLRTHPKLGPLKEYWMEASPKAKNMGRYDSNDLVWFEEGIEGFVSHTGSIYVYLRQTLLKIKAALSSSGCKDIDALHKNSVLELQSEASIAMGKVHDIISA
ncbi:IMP dehydrogenase [Candidatus Woesearchaeota archaeon]|nr:IMP dehydrogenase [Candidatus Woesearchaeota archaeon]